MTGDLNVNNHRITNVTGPREDDDEATKDMSIIENH